MKRLKRDLSWQTVVAASLCSTNSSNKGTGNFSLSPQEAIGPG